jgi:cytochrome P450
MDAPRDPVAAVTHAEPYAYYRDLVARRPVYGDDALGLWIVAIASAVTAALTSELCRVRPPAEPVPRALLGSPAGAVFGGLVRMNDGPAHAALKPGVSATPGSLDPGAVVEHARRHARALARTAGLGLADFAFRLPAYVVASLLGVADETLEQTARWTGDLVRCFAPGGTAEQAEAGTVAAACLLERLPTQSVGFLFQSYDATAGLIGNTPLLALAHHHELRVDADLAAIVREVVRFDPPV